jgi:hypothetical protein
VTEKTRDIVVLDRAHKSGTNPAWDYRYLPALSQNIGKDEQRTDEQGDYLDRTLDAHEQIRKGVQDIRNFFFRIAPTTQYSNSD